MKSRKLPKTPAERAAYNEGVLDERERIIQVLVRTNPVEVEDRCHPANPFTGQVIQFVEAYLREVLIPKP